MAKKDLNKNVNTVEKKDEVKNPYDSKTREEMLELLVAKDGLITGYKTEVDKLNKQIEDCKKEYDGITEKSMEVISKYKELEAETKKLNETHAAEIDELNETHEAEIAELNETHAAEINELNGTCKAKLEGQTIADLKKINDLKSEHAAELKEVKASYDADAEKLKKTHKSALEKQATKLESKYQAKLVEAKAEHDAEVKCLKDEINELKTLGIEGIYSEKLRNAFLEVAKSERKRMLRVLTNELEKSESSIDEAYDSLKKDAEKKITTMKELSDSIKEVKDEITYINQQNEYNNAKKAVMEQKLDSICDIYRKLVEDVEDA